MKSMESKTNDLITPTEQYKKKHFHYSLQFIRMYAENNRLYSAFNRLYVSRRFLLDGFANLLSASVITFR